MMKPTAYRYTLLLAFFAVLMLSALPSRAQRRITPVNNAATATQPINEFTGDTARINARMRASMVHYHDEEGNTIYVDTITGREWRDTTAMLMKKKPMQYPLWQSVSIGVDIWNPVMRVFGQKFGLIDFSAQLNLHNRYKPVFETGLGIASNTPPGNNFTYKSPLSTYFRIGIDYNFLYNSTTDYQYTVGVRYGLSPFSYKLENITIASDYWDETAVPDIPSQHSVAGWFEFTMGLRVKLWGPLSAGWIFRYHMLAHESNNAYGKPWYIPGFGSRGSSISGSFTFCYTIDLNKKPVDAVNPTEPEFLIPTPITDNPYEPGITNSSSQQQQALPVTKPTEQE